MSRPLSLKTESIRVLSSPELEGVGGGLKWPGKGTDSKNILRIRVSLKPRPRPSPLRPGGGAGDI
jgi:hypothetical protein